MNVAQIYEGSDGEATKRLYAALEARASIGGIATNLFRAQKCSARAKVYRGGGFKSAAYERKDWALGLLCDALDNYALPVGIQWGWKVDANTPGYSQVLYIDLPNGQVSFHAARRHKGPEYSRDWDGQRGASPERIVAFCQAVLDGTTESLAPAPIAERPETVSGVQGGLF